MIFKDERPDELNSIQVVLVSSGDWSGIIIQQGSFGDSSAHLGWSLVVAFQLNSSLSVFIAVASGSTVGIGLSLACLALRRPAAAFALGPLLRSS